MTFIAPSAQYDVAEQVQHRSEIDRRIQALVAKSGVYTPVLTSSGGGETITYTTQLGQWVRLTPSLMWVSADVTIASKAGGSGDIQVSLPAPAASILAQPMMVEIDNMGATWTGAPMARIAATAAFARLRELVTGSATAAWGKLGATCTIRLTGVYQVAA